MTIGASIFFPQCTRSTLNGTCGAFCSISERFLTEFGDNGVVSLDVDGCGSMFTDKPDVEAEDLK